MRDVGPDFRWRLLARLVQAAGVSAFGMELATACGARSPLDPSGVDRYEPSSGGAVSFGGGAATGGAGGPSLFDASSSGGLINAGGADAGGADAGALACRGMDAGVIDAGPTPPILCRCAKQQTDAGPDGCLSAAAALSDAQNYLGLTCQSMSALQQPVARAILRGPLIENGACCYDVKVDYVFCGYVGRAFLCDEGFLKATARRGANWRSGSSPSAEHLSPKTRQALLEAWAKDGLFEHASVATFSRFAIQLLAVGAPADLLHDTLAAGRDEIRHAELCFALASAYAGESLEPDSFPVAEQMHIDRDLCSIAAETVVEGCIGETLAAMQARAQLLIARDPAVIAALETTIEDETRHAELAWRVVAWAIRAGGEAVRTTVVQTFSGFRPPHPPNIDLDDVDLEAFAAHGRLTPSDARAVALDALEHVVRPAAAALLERDVMPRNAATPSALGRRARRVAFAEV